MQIIDTHLHLIYRDKFTYGWLARHPHLDRQWDIESYVSEATGLGITHALHMEADVLPRQAEDETRFVLGLHPFVKGAIAAARPEEVDFPVHLERLAEIGSVRGIRRLLQDDPDHLSAGRLFRDNIDRLAAHGMTFDICVRPDQLGIARDLAAACPNVQFVLDHCGNPPIASGDISAWRRDIARLAELPNVAGKISGIINNANADWTAETLRPAVEHMIESFSWDRVVWGSDRPVFTIHGTLTRWVEATRAIVSGASEDEQSKLFHRNAQRIYRA